jgi:hypothetical protein
MTNSTQEEESKIALLGLMATEGEKVSACPSDELLATFIEGKLTGKARQAMLADLWPTAVAKLEKLVASPEAPPALRFNLARLLSVRPRPTEARG